MTKIIFEAKVDGADVEDGGAAVILSPDWKVTGGDDNIFVRIQSWDENFYDHPNYKDNASKYENYKLGHQSIQELMGKKVRVTVEVIDE